MDLCVCVCPACILHLLPGPHLGPGTAGLQVHQLQAHGAQEVPQAHQAGLLGTPGWSSFPPLFLRRQPLLLRFHGGPRGVFGVWCRVKAHQNLVRNAPCYI